MTVTRFAAWPILLGALSSPFLADCGAAKDLQQVASGCDEFNAGAQGTANLDVDANVKAFVQASAELRDTVGRIKTDVKASCVDICNKLGVADTWSTFGDDDKSISNDEKTGACDKAAAEVNAIMVDAKAKAHFALIVTAPKCTVDTDVQASCEGSCMVDASCTPGMIDVTTRCDPAQLSVQCEGTCNANAVCEGTAEAAATCEGTCDATCQGECTGTCVAEAGTTTENDAQCSGKCKGTCKGSCTGDCHVMAQAGVQCGASATCRGGCTGTATAPKCETELKELPPMCHADANCEASCSARAEANVHCTEPKVVLSADVTASARITALKGAIEANLPKLILAAKTEGPLVLAAAQKVALTGQAVANGAASLGGKSVACAGVALQAAASASVSMNVSVQGSGSVEHSCSSNES